MTDEEIISLFEPPPDELVEASVPAILRCKCGRLVNVSRPNYCGCGEAKLYWRTLEGEVLHLSQMTLGHLSNLVRMLGAKVDEYPHGDKRAKLEEALDFLYAEIGSRDSEIQQATSIQNALMRSLTRKDSGNA